MNSKLISGFHISAVTTPDKLYDWKEENGLLSKLVARVKNGTCFLLYGERRSGKTSLLNCLEHMLEIEADAPIPVLINFQACDGFKGLGSDGGYRFIIAHICEAFLKARQRGQKWIPEILTLNNLGGNFFQYIHMNLIPNNSLYDAILADIEKFLVKNKRSIVLIFDEYEHLPQVFNNNHDTFFYLFRTLQNRYDRDNGGIFCVIAGADDTDKFQADTGSPQFNLITSKIRVPPLVYAAFESLWKDCYQECSADCKKNIDRCHKNIKNIYDLCGGRPGFAKLLGQEWAFDADMCDPNPLRKWLGDIYSRQSENVRQTLLDIAVNRPVPFNPIYIRRLEELYLIEKINDPEVGGYCIKGGFWHQFLQEKAKEVSSGVAPSIQHAGDLARLIIKHKKISALLSLRKGKGELDDWLEFKTLLIPSKDSGDCRNNTDAVQVSNDEYLWHTIKAILSMRSTRGGLILIGVKDDGVIGGVEKPEKYTSDGDFIKNEYTQKLTKQEIKLKNKQIVICLKNCFWKIDHKSSNWINFTVQNVDGKYIICIEVFPVYDKEESEMLVRERLNGKVHREYLLVRTKTPGVIELASGDERRQHIEAMRKQSTDDLHNVWCKLCQM